MADDSKYLRELAWEMAGFVKETESVPSSSDDAVAADDQDVEMETVAVAADPSESSDVDIVGFSSPSDGGGAESPVQEGAQNITVAEDEDVEMGEESQNNSTSDENSGQIQSPTQTPMTNSTSDENSGQTQSPTQTLTNSTSDENSGQNQSPTQTLTSSTSDEESGQTQSPTQTLTNSTSDEKSGHAQTVNVQERASFMAWVEFQFLEENDPYRIHNLMTATLDGFQAGRLKKDEAHARGCVLLIGNARMLQAFERLLKLDAGKILDAWRYDAMFRLLRDMDRDFKNTVNALTVNKEQGIADHLGCFKRLIQDPEERNELVADLRKADSEDALDRLEQKMKGVLQRMEAFLSNYIGQKLYYEANKSTSTSGNSL